MLSPNRNMWPSQRSGCCPRSTRRGAKAVHIELTEMLRCPEAHREEMLVLSTGEMKDRMVRSGLIGCPVCHNEYPISRGIVNFRRSKERSEEHTSELQSRQYLVCRLLLEKKKTLTTSRTIAKY